MNRLPVILFITTIAIAAGTWLFGWLAVPLIAAIAGAMVARQPRASFMIALGSGLAWIVLLGVDAMSGHLLALAGVLGHLFPLPWPLLLVVTITYVMLMAWSAAVIGGAVRRAVKPLRAA